MRYLDDLTADYARSRLDYNKATGTFTWKPRPLESFVSERGYRTWNARYAGKAAGYLRGDGYLTIGIDYKAYLAHRLGWLIVTGSWPAVEVDHKDLNPANNKWDNFREATSSQNHCNRPLAQNNTSGYKGVCWDKERCKWKAQIKHHGKNCVLGRFSDKEAAYEARLQAAAELHRDFARAG